MSGAVCLQGGSAPRWVATRLLMVRAGRAGQSQRRSPGTKLGFIFAKLRCPAPQGANGTAPPPTARAPPAIPGGQEGPRGLSSHPSIPQGGKGRYHFAET